MDFIFVLIGLSTVWLFMFKIEWLFLTKTFVINVIYNILLFGISFLLVKYQISNPKFLLLLRMPLFSTFVFLILYKGFKKIYQRNPENTFWVFTGKPIQDVIFTLLFWFLGVGLPFILIKM
jgi:hypothetical protein